MKSLYPPYTLGAALVSGTRPHPSKRRARWLEKTGNPKALRWNPRAEEWRRRFQNCSARRGRRTTMSSAMSTPRSGTLSSLLSCCKSSQLYWNLGGPQPKKKKKRLCLNQWKGRDICRFFGFVSGLRKCGSENLGRDIFCRLGGCVRRWCECGCDIAWC